MLKYCKLRNETILRVSDEIYDSLNDTLFRNSGNGTMFEHADAKNSIEFDELEPIQVATAIMFLSGLMQVHFDNGLLR